MAEEAKADTGQAGNVEPAQKEATPPGGDAPSPQAKPGKTLLSTEEREARIRNWLQPGADQGAGPAKEGASPQEEPAGSESPPAGSEEGHVSPDLSHSSPPDGEAPSKEEPESPPAKGERWPKGYVENVRRLKEKAKHARAAASEAKTEVASLRAEVESLRTQIQEVRPPAPAAAPAASPSSEMLGDLSDPAEIMKEADAAEEALDWVDNNIFRVNDEYESLGAQLEANGAPPPEGGWTPSLVAEKMARIRKYSTLVKRAVPKRMEWVQNEERNIQTVMAVCPELADPKSDLAQKVALVLENRPYLKAQADWPILVVSGLLGVQELVRRTEATQGNGKGIRKAPRLPGAPRSAPPATEGKGSEMLRANATRKGASVEEREAYISSLVRDSLK